MDYERDEQIKRLLAELSAIPDSDANSQDYIRAQLHTLHLSRREIDNRLRYMRDVQQVARRLFGGKLVKKRNRRSKKRTSSRTRRRKRRVKRQTRHRKRRK